MPGGGVVTEVGTTRLISGGTGRYGRSGDYPVRENQLAKDIVKRQLRMQKHRRSQDRLWDDLDTYVTSRRSKYNIGYARGDDARDPGGSSIYDSTAQLAMQDFADNFQGQISSPIIKWWTGRFRGPLKKDTRALKWMDEVEEIMDYEWQRSPWYEELNEGVQDGTSHGICHIAGPQWDFKKNKAMFRTFHPRQIFCTFDLLGNPTCWHDKFPITGRQIYREFPDAQLSMTTRKKIDENPFREFMCIHAIYENDEPDVHSAASIDMPWSSVWVLEETQELLEQSGYQTNPMDTWIWRKAGTLLYCTSPAIDAIYDVMMTNAASKSLLKSVQLAVEPSLLITPGVKGNVNLYPAGQTILQSPNDKVTAFQYPTQFGIGVEQINAMQEALVKKFRANLFKIMSTMPHQMTAFQAAGVQGEQVSGLIPITTRSSSQMLIPKINKMFHLLAKVGRLPKPPDSIMRYADSPVDVQLMGPVQTAAKRFLNSTGFNALMGQLEEIQKVMPNLAQAIIEGFNPDEIRKFLMESNSAPNKILFDDEQLAAIRQMKAKQMAQQQNVQNLKDLAEAASKGGQAPQQGSPTDSMMRGSTGGGQ